MTRCAGFAGGGCSLQHCRSPQFPNVRLQQLLGTQQQGTLVPLHQWSALSCASIFSVLKMINEWWWCRYPVISWDVKWKIWLWSPCTTVEIQVKEKFLPSTPTSGNINCRPYRSISSLLKSSFMTWGSCTVGWTKVCFSYKKVNFLVAMTIIDTVYPVPLTIPLDRPCSSFTNQQHPPQMNMNSKRGRQTYLITSCQSPLQCHYFFIFFLNNQPEPLDFFSSRSACHRTPNVPIEPTQTSDYMILLWQQTIIIQMIYLKSNTWEDHGTDKKKDDRKYRKRLEEG